MASLLVISALASACQGTATDLDATVQDAVASAVVEVEVTPTPTPHVTATALPTPTPTAAPTSTPTATPVPTPVPRSELIDQALAYSSLRDADCPAALSDPSIGCYRAQLPMRIETPADGDVVDLLIARVDTGDELDAGPTVYFQGGPGVGSVGLARFYPNRGRDMIFFDQRGTGESTPKLDCLEVEALWESQRTDDESTRTDDEVVYDAYGVCVERLRSAGIDLDAFNTAAVAADAELIRRLFDLEAWTIWGSSYGTRIALTTMRDYPQSVRGAVLDSVVPFEVDFFSSIPANGLRSFDALDAACDATACGAQRGDVQTALEALAQRLDETPAVVPVQRPVSGTSFDYRIAGGDLLSMVFSQLYSTRQLRALPRQIALFDSGGAEELVYGYVQSRDPERLDLAEALYYATWCREEFAFHDPAADDTAIEIGVDRFGPGFDEALSSEGIERLCEIFAVAPAPPIDDQPLQSTIPAVVFAGAFDPITPPQWSRSVADQLSNATYIEMPDHGHGMTGACPESLFTAFLIDPSSELDVSCVEATGAPVFE